MLARGALIVTVLTGLVCVLLRHVLTAVSGAGGRVLFLVPAVLMLIVLGQYSHPVPMSLGALTALVCASAYLGLGRRSAALRGGAFVVGSALVYYALGGAPYVLFALLCALFELLSARRYRLGAVYLLCAVGPRPHCP